MLQSITKKEAPGYFYNEHLLTVEYSFSEYAPENRRMTSSKVWLDILFVHPQNSEAVTMRIAKSTLILCQPKDVIEAVVHREIRHFLQQPQQPQAKGHGTAYSYTGAAPALANVA
jgi:hypothetical protein